MLAGILLYIDLRLFHLIDFMVYILEFLIVGCSEIGSVRHGGDLSQDIFINMHLLLLVKDISKGVLKRVRSGSPGSHTDCVYPYCESFGDLGCRERVNRSGVVYRQSQG